MNQLTPEQSALVTLLVERLGKIGEIKAVVLGGSHARGRAKPESDIDLGLFYSEAAPFSIQQLRELAEAVNDAATELSAAIESVAQLCRETVALTDGQYQSRFTLPM